MFEYDDTSHSAGADPNDTGVKLYPNLLLNHLLLVWAIEYVEHSPTQYSTPDRPSDAVIVDVVDLDAIGSDGQPGLVSRRTWWRQARLIQEMKPSIGKPNPKLGVMIRGRATRGQPPYVLELKHGDPVCLQRANLWRQANAAFLPSIATGSNPTPTNPVPQAPTQLEMMAQQAQRPQGAQKNVYYAQDEPLPPRPPAPPLPDTPPF